MSRFIKMYSSEHRRVYISAIRFCQEDISPPEEKNSTVRLSRSFNVVGGGRRAKDGKG